MRRRLLQMRRYDPQVDELMAAAEAGPGGGHLEAAREVLLRQLDVYRCGPWAWGASFPTPPRFQRTLPQRPGINRA